MIDKAIERAKKFEGFSATPYICPEGKITIGYGTNLQRGFFNSTTQAIIGAAMFRTIQGGCGIGADWSGLVLDKVESSFVLEQDLRDCWVNLTHARPWIENLQEEAQLVLLDMCYNLGLTGLLKFKRMLAAAEAGEWLKMSDEMLDSKWAKQVGPRATQQAAEIAHLVPEVK